ncbi:DoxX family protein [Niabella sp. W65]|nr:DoxX family protein [Niabella sp. W65]MCH7364516.1 DoxX family protein [Niabella sp. W65]
MDYKFYLDILQSPAGDKGFYILFKLANYTPGFVARNSFGNWLIIAGIAFAGAFLLEKITRFKSLDYDKWYYWLRVLLRYRLAVAAISYGLIKLFPLQMPYPSLGNLHTAYGDFLPWKIYFHTTAIAPPFEIFLGGVELLSGLLLLSRKTTTFGAGILAGYYGNVFASNIAYSMGYEAYSLQLTIFAVVLFVYDAPRLYNLLVARKYTIANSYRPVFNTKEKWLKKIARPLIAIFIIWLGVAAYHNYTTAPYKYPAAKGLPGAYGFYNVRIFKWNNQEIPYSATDLNRWQNVVFEKWATLSIKTAKPIVIDNGLGISLPIMITKETLSQLVWAEGVISPTVWTPPSIINLSLANKNKNHKEETFQLTYRLLGSDTIIIKGVNQQNDSIYAELNKINRKYLLFEGRRKPVKL